MLALGSIVVVEDDLDDQQLFLSALQNLNIKNTIRVFSNGMEALAWMVESKENPLIILCDVKMPKMGGIELRENMNKNERLKKKSIPFVFVTGSANKKMVSEAYSMSVQGYFIKPNSLEEWTSLLDMILKYWWLCFHPNSSSRHL